MSHAEYNFRFHKANNQELIITVTDSTGGVVDITGADIKWGMATGSYSSVLLNKSSTAGTSEVSSTNSTGGEFIVKLYPSDTSTLPADVYYFESEVSDATGQIYTVVTGHLTLEDTLL